MDIFCVKKMIERNREKVLIVILSITLSVPLIAQKMSLSSNNKLDSILSSMSIEDKVGQMTQLNVKLVLKPEKNPIQVDSQALDFILKNQRVGSFMNTIGRALTLMEWNYLQKTIRYFAEKNDLVPLLYGIDAVHGANYTMGSVIFPHQLGQAASWNEDLVFKASEITALECRASGIPWVFAPVVDLGRQPLWGQFFETYGEDVFLAERMAVASVSGLQNKDQGLNVGGCAKHYVGYGLPQNGKDRTTVHISDNILRELHIPPFKAAIDAGVMSVMIGSHDLNGLPMNVNSYLLTNVLRDELGFEGVLVTDWADIKNLHITHRVTTDYRGSILAAISAGVDMAMVPEDFIFYETLLDLVLAGEISEERITQSTRRIVDMKVKLGLFDEQDYLLNKKIGEESHQRVAYDLASESITVLKNVNHTLPLNKKLKVFVTGPAANDIRFQIGAWGRTWQGMDTIVTSESIMSIYARMKELGEIALLPGIAVDTILDVDSALNMASKAEVIVLCLGENPSTEKPADINSLTISNTQLEYFNRLHNLEIPIVVVLSQNRPRLLGDIAENASAVILAYQPGAMGGKAIADVIYGEVNPSGKLPFTYPRYEHGISTYDHAYADEVDPMYGTNGFNPQWEFGHGLSYSEFTYSNLSLGRDSVFKDDTLIVLVELENKGSRTGKEVVQVYVSDEVASLVPSVKRLRDFEKIELDENQSKSVTFHIDVHDLGFVHPGEASKSVESGWFTLSVGDLSARFFVKH